MQTVEKHSTYALPLHLNATATAPGGNSTPSEHPTQANAQNETGNKFNASAITNATSKTDVLKNMMPVTCPEESVVDFDANRYPQVITKVRCNGYGTLCLSDDGRLACKEVNRVIKVYKYIGLDSQGKKYYRQEDYLVPFACTCAA